MTKKIFALTLASVMLLSSQVAMAAPTPTNNNIDKAQLQHSVTASNDIEVNLNLRVGEGRQLTGSNFWVGVGSNLIYLDIYGNLLALEPGMATVVADHPNGDRIYYYVTITN
ncbi:hypothetical protein [Paenibacillus apiarius]|uniref:hypothetical protein n=1 Tax=Paenibacillus apiarius TaxID=46240 RepID=UPI00197E73AB|nr:hypothetical protein [Paenibacillus apiarius]MBN3527495.1 hypothetical protein [Paenibacillus apiarius]